ncbi:hypothetical protein Anapl_09907 [Anas platyrhynchos]|uniref:Uncharacterized protein n=1 Tax=Anas platyrhynchos TaxID=8839 RepID=R0LY79_ANAPL|nr:hypothetical protein Anapl_09907 [Anas platyrhynchos]
MGNLRFGVRSQQEQDSPHVVERCSWNPYLSRQKGEEFSESTNPTMDIPAMIRMRYIMFEKEKGNLKAQICKEKKSQKLADAVKIEDMQIYKPVIRCHLLVHEEKEKIDSPI